MPLELWFSGIHHLPDNASKYDCLLIITSLLLVALVVATADADFSLSPQARHTSSSRPLNLAVGSKMEVKMESKKKSAERANPLESPFIGHWLLVVSLSLVTVLLFHLLLPLMNNAFHCHVLSSIHPLTASATLLAVTFLGLLPVMRSKDENAQIGYFGVALVTIILIIAWVAKLAIQGAFELIALFIWPFLIIRLACLFGILFMGRKYYLKYFSSE